ncbi:crotonase/enoyl-CoA hydratase family protein [Hoyosella rhizosphaerae]|uniref:Enoyl-CoA hydratase n=1 Tax=Hoyosella rhizosphaerae TaxID=1755582 RepID=A0A916UD62_9ACTN|nr:crotonase/enoyl-CoA hydratase family protein [Hoyosella rhizosphaerae]MBN4925690.1 crotonase/enoyl-CoA hydratase family protein [Hoyosella rhizosphaerae]GGC68671.1 enoyl-CoA hydratase [Hoyosella rhizosphaerae]
MSITIDKQGPVTVVTINRPEVRNAVDHHHAAALTEAFEDFNADPDASVAVFTGAGGHFCAGADLKAVAQGDIKISQPHQPGPAGMGPTRMLLNKPVIAAIEGYAVAGGLELALWADLRVVHPDATFGVYCRRWGVPLIDGGTVRLPRLIGHSHALDMILTGRSVGAEEALRMGLANRIEADPVQAAIELATQIAAFPQTCMRQDRLSSYEQESLSIEQALVNEWQRGMISFASDTISGAGRFAAGAGRHGSFGGNND